MLPKGHLRLLLLISVPSALSVFAALYFLLGRYSEVILLLTIVSYYSWALVGLAISSGNMLLRLGH